MSIPIFIIPLLRHFAIQGQENTQNMPAASELHCSRGGLERKNVGLDEPNFDLFTAFKLDSSKRILLPFCFVA